jgi:hypothetical protein
VDICDRAGKNRVSISGQGRTAVAPAKTQPHEHVYQIKVTLLGIRPAIWRRLLVPSSITLHRLHHVLQTAMGWQDGHMHQFVTANGEYFGRPGPASGLTDIKNENRFALDQLLRRQKQAIVYEYDFGDSWEHRIVLERVLTAAEAGAVPRCTGGKRACPPEDCGGVPGYWRLLEAIRDPSHPDAEELREWLGGGFDPEAFDPTAVNARLTPRTRRGVWSA